MQIHNCEQGTPEWFAVRCGVPTASNFDKIITTKGEPSKQAEKYMFRLAGEKVSGQMEEGYTNLAMQRGVELEAEARSYYEVITGQTVEKVGFCLADDGYGCSPDGLVGDDGLIEIKCPQIATQVDYLLKGSLPTEYFQQVQGQLLVTGRKWVDFISYYPMLKPLIVRVNREEDFINKLEIALKHFVKDLKETVKKIDF